MPDKYNIFLGISGGSIEHLKKSPEFSVSDGIGACLFDNLLPGDRKVRDDAQLARMRRRYKELGEHVLDGIADGVSAIICDFKKNRLFVAADKVGHFTYYYLIKDDQLWLSDRLSALLGSGPGDISPKSFENYLTTGYIPGNESIVLGVRKVPPGCYLSVDRGKIELKRYHRHNRGMVFKITEDIRKLIRGYLKRSIGLYARGKSVGLSLSGGFDSTLLCQYALKLSRELHAFTLHLETCSSASVYQSQRIAKLYGVRHRVLTMKLKDYITGFPNVYAHFDEPVFDMDMPFIAYLLKNIPQDIRFVFHGMGSDEMLGSRLRMFVKKFTNRSVYNYSVLRLPQALMLHDRMGSFYHARYIFPFLSLDMIELGLSLPLRFKQDKNLLRSIEPGLKKLFRGPHPPPMRLPDTIKKTLREFYSPDIEKSAVLRGLIGKKRLCDILKSGEGRKIFPLILFYLWAKEKGF